MVLQGFGALKVGISKLFVRVLICGLWDCLGGEVRQIIYPAIDVTSRPTIFVYHHQVKHTAARKDALFTQIYRLYARYGIDMYFISSIRLFAVRSELWHFALVLNVLQTLNVIS